MNTKFTAPVAIGALLSVLPMTMPAAHADNQQKNKNLWRNLAIGAGVIAGHGLINHNGTETLLGAAGAAYSANRYEHERHNQSVRNSRRYHRSWRNGYHDQYRGYSTYRPTGAYGTYPNIQNFTRNGHVYTRNLDTGEVYLSKW